MLLQRNDQTVYDFIKWYATTGRQPDYDWDDLEQPFLNIVGDNAFEPVDCLLDLEDTQFLVAATLLKVRILLDLKEMQKQRWYSRKQQQEIRERHAQLNDRQAWLASRINIADPMYLAAAAEFSSPWCSPIATTRKFQIRDEPSVSSTTNNLTKPKTRRNSLYAPHTEPIDIQFRSSIVQTTKDLHTWGTWSKLIHYFEAEVHKLFVAVHRRNQLVWRVLSSAYLPESDPRIIVSSPLIDMHREAVLVGTACRKPWLECDVKYWLLKKLNHPNGVR
ncbi:hypothetical protein HK097_001485 [Rhizophlyctis rosea]|uniref:Uncharacterized protein n=1 Tax=Rhizophlyctis rosea TaxID=64517 RepID=A0AAD5X962_9FUNG|nr:hypothetical protein HK097_001485 [Rhizophlyctis rosea]